METLHVCRSLVVVKGDHRRRVSSSERYLVGSMEAEGWDIWPPGLGIVQQGSPDAPW